MEHEVHIKHCVSTAQSWWVGKIVEDGSVEGADFTGPFAEQRAKAYAEWRYGERPREIRES